jgi:mRNA (guanine-N7-)-methyltransferase
VKKKLITSVAKRDNTLIDYACGKGGDFSKWIEAKLSFVFGIDIARDNLENRIDGACARFLNYRKDFKNVPYALFVHGNSAENIRSGRAALNDKAEKICRAVFGTAAATEKGLGPAVERQAGKGEHGFNISSCQFALHYFFESRNTLRQFLINVSQCTAIGGYFVGTCYDGKQIFNRLRQKDSVSIYDKNYKIWEIRKEYEEEEFPDTVSSIGYKIEVFQESINKMFPEYLVNFDFLDRLMENYGFKLLNRQEAKDVGLPEGSGLFVDLYNGMMDEVKRNPKKRNEYGRAVNMSDVDKNISFLNRYFVYKKMRNVDAEKVVFEDEDEDEEEEMKLDLDTGAPTTAATAATAAEKKGKRSKKEGSAATVEGEKKPRKPRKLKEMVTLNEEKEEEVVAVEPETKVPAEEAATAAATAATATKVPEKKPRKPRSKAVDL